jgi:hypothetical protein
MGETTSEAQSKVEKSNGGGTAPEFSNDVHHSSLIYRIVAPSISARLFFLFFLLFLLTSLESAPTAAPVAAPIAAPLLMLLLVDD